MLHQKTTAPVVKQPFYLNIVLKNPIGNTVGFQVISLRIIHGDKKLNGMCLYEKQTQYTEKEMFTPHFRFLYYSVSKQQR